MFRKHVQMCAGALVALTLMALPAKAITVVAPGGAVNPVVNNETYTMSSGVIAPGAFSQSYFYTYVTPFSTTASAVALELGSVVLFSSLTMTWDGPGAVFQQFDVLANPNVDFLLSLADGAGLYTLIFSGTVSSAEGGLYQAALTTAETPLPGALLLFGTVLAGGVGLMRRRRTSIAQA